MKTNLKCFIGPGTVHVHYLSFPFFYLLCNNKFYRHDMYVSLTVARHGLKWDKELHLGYHHYFRGIKKKNFNRILTKQFRTSCQVSKVGVWDHLECHFTYIVNASRVLGAACSWMDSELWEFKLWQNVPVGPLTHPRSICLQLILNAQWIVTFNSTPNEA